MKPISAFRTYSAHLLLVFLLFCGFSNQSCFGQEEPPPKRLPDRQILRMHVWEFINKGSLDHSNGGQGEATRYYMACFDRQIMPLLKRTPNRKRWKNLYVTMGDWADGITGVGINVRPPFGTWARGKSRNRARLKAAFWQILLQAHHRKRWHVFREPNRFPHKRFSFQNYFTVLDKETPERNENLPEFKKALKSLHRNHRRLERLIKRYPKRIQRTIREFQTSALGEYFE